MIRLPRIFPRARGSRARNGWAAWLAGFVLGGTSLWLLVAALRRWLRGD